MHIERTDRGFQQVVHLTYPEGAQDGKTTDRMVCQSSAIDEDNPTGFEKPGSSYLWIGENHHINRAEVAKLITHLSAWLESGSLETGINP